MCGPSAPVCGPICSCVRCRCPPSDWRTPPLIERTNVLLRATADEYNLHFVDTAPLLAPMWDHAPDWVRSRLFHPPPFLHSDIKTHARACTRARSSRSRPSATLRSYELPSESHAARRTRHMRCVWHAMHDCRCMRARKFRRCSKRSSTWCKSVCAPTSGATYRCTRPRDGQRRSWSGALYEPNRPETRGGRVLGGRRAPAH